MNQPLVELRQIDFGYGPSRPILRGCDLALAPGDRLVLWGSNGSGKTTLLHLLVGLLRPTAGEIRAFGRPCRCEADFREVRRRVGLLFQDSDDQLFCPTVAEDVAFGPFNLGKSRHEVAAIVNQTLAELGLADFAQRITHKLSGGEKRLVAMATVLAMQPDVLLLDEPTGGLDDEATARITHLLAHLPQAMVLVTHDHALANAVATRSAQLVDGRMMPVE